MIESQKYGRKISILLSFGIVSLGSLTIFFLKENLFFYLLVLVKAGSCIAFTIIYPYTAELYNTFIRTTAAGFLSMICRIGGIMMPWVINYLF
jgi:MFS family permease